jgi:hypothetical protein
VVAVDAELGHAQAAERLEVVLAEVAEAEDEVDGPLEQALEREVGRLVGDDEGERSPSLRHRPAFGQDGPAGCL